MQAQNSRTYDKITTKDSYFSGDECQPSNEEKSKNSSSGRRRRSKETNKRNLLSKKNQTAETLEWLSQNYELIQGVCVPRCVLYTHYLDFCKKRKFTPAGPATFGKLIRQRFPKLTTRRLGTRGQSKYHYYGISIKETSVYYHSVYSGKGLTRFSGSEGRKKGITKKFSGNKKAGNILPEFPNASEMLLNENLSVEKVETFIIMYRTHCQRLLDTVMNANFSEVHKFLLHFWRGMPQHMIPVLECDSVINIIVVCDSLLYKIFNDVLIPSSIQDIPDSLTEEIQDFAITFVKSLESCLENTPVLLKSKKLQVAKNFARLLKRNMTFINLAQTARSVFLSYESMSGILNEFRSLDLRKILSELLFLTEKESVDLPVLLMFMEEFENLLVKQAPIEAYAEWFDSIVEEYVLKDQTNMVNNASGDLSKRSQTFLTSWSFITSRILQELTLKGAPSFGSFQLIIMMFEEYILLIIENQMMAQLDEDLKLNLTRKRGGSQQRFATESPSDKEKENVFNKQNQLHLRQQAQGKHSFENIPHDIQHYENSERKHYNSDYDVQKHSINNPAQQRSRPLTEQLHAPPQDDFITGEAYLGVNVVPSEIYRVENSRGNQAYTYNFLYAQSDGTNFDSFRIGSERDETSEVNSSHNSDPIFQSCSYTTAPYRSHVESFYTKGQHSEGQYLGHYQGQYLSQIYQEKDLYQRINIEQSTCETSNHHHLEGLNEGQTQGQIFFQGHSNEGHQGHGYKSQGHPGQGQNQSQGYYQYNLQVHNNDQKYISQNDDRGKQNLDQNMNYSPTNDGSNYLYLQNMSNTLTTASQSSNSYQENTILPSFLQLSAQLSSNSRLSTGY